MKSTKFKRKTEKGITLIALIITIVVLMILAAVAINSITNEGILSQAGSTANKYNEAVKDEESFLQDYEDILKAANGDYKDKNFKVGDEVSITVGSETHNFYVIEDKTSLGKVVLLAQRGINTETLRQEDENYITFSSTPYWNDENGKVLFTDSTETGVPDESHYANRAAYNYGEKIGGKGRLMTEVEARNLLKDSANNDMIYGPTGAKLAYWLGTAHSGQDGVYIVYGYAGNLNGGGYAGDCHVRPVIEISKSKLS